MIADKTIVELLVLKARLALGFRHFLYFDELKITNSMKHPICYLIALLLSVSPTLAQDSSPSDRETLAVANVDRIASAALEEERVLNVYLPDGFHPDSSHTYPVIYLLDGSANEDFLHTVGLVQFLNMYNLLPRSIVVGIANVDRYRDFTHPSEDPEDLKNLPQSGGSEAFMQFIGGELQPFVNEHYPTNGHTTIIGQSLGGLLATEILFKHPELFDDYIIVSPSLWWDQQSMINEAATHLDALPAVSKRVFVSLGEEHPVMHEVADMLVKALGESEKHSFELTYEPILTEDHATILHRAVYRGFEVFYPKEED